MNSVLRRRIRSATITAIVIAILWTVTGSAPPSAGATKPQREVAMTSVAPMPPSDSGPRTPSGAGPGAPILVASRLNGRPAVVGRVLVRFRAGTTTVQRQLLRGALFDRVATGAEVISEIDGATELWNIAAAASAVDVAAFIRSDPIVEDAEPDYIEQLADTPNDPFVSRQWALNTIQAPAAWSVTHGATSTLVAVVDTGIFDDGSRVPAVDGLFGHPDLRGKVALDRDFTGSGTTMDAVGHGTRVAGIIGAATNNGVGVAGVGYNARLLNAKACTVLKVCPQDAVLAGIRWAVDSGARIINLSLSHSGACDSFYQAAIDYAWSHNALVVAAAGNDSSTDLYSPASCNHVLSVASTGVGDRKSIFSNFGGWVTVAAPGESIVSTSFDSGANEYGYDSGDGTSFAAPLVAGVAALVVSTSWGTTAQGIADRIRTTADPVAGTGAYWQGGRINAARAVAPPAPVTVPTPPAATVRPATGTSARGTLLSSSDLAGYTLRREKADTLEEQAAAITNPSPYATASQLLQAWGYVDSWLREYVRTTSTGIYSVTSQGTSYATAQGTAGDYALNRNAFEHYAAYQSRSLARVGEDSAAFVRDSTLNYAGTNVPVDVSEVTLLFRAGGVSHSIIVSAFRGQIDFDLVVRLATLQASRSLAGQATPTPSQFTPTPTPTPLNAPGALCPLVGPGIPPPSSVPTGTGGWHAAWYGQSGYPTLCPGQRSLATVAFLNTGTRGWATRPGEAAFLGTWDPEPGQDMPSPLGGDGTRNSPDTGWPSFNRVAMQPADYVGPGQVAWFQFAIQAPSTPGTYRLALRALVEGTQWLEDYGVFWYVTVVASSNGVSPTPTPRPTPTPTIAPAPLSIVPLAAQLGVGATQQFAITGGPNGLPVAWSVAGGCGSISSAGFFRATGVGTCVVVATVGAFSASATVSVTGPAPSTAPPASGATVSTTTDTTYSGSNLFVRWTDPSGEAGKYLTLVLQGTNTFNWIWTIRGSAGETQIGLPVYPPGLYQIRMYDSSNRLMAAGNFVSIR